MIKLDTPIELKQGAIYAVRTDEILSYSGTNRLKEYLETLHKETGAKFVFLGNLKLTTAEELREILEKNG